MGRFEVQFNRFLEVGESLFLGLALAGDVEFQALGDIPLPLTPNGSREWTLHDLIVSQERALRTVPQIQNPIRSLPVPGRPWWRPACFPPRSDQNPQGSFRGRDLTGLWTAPNGNLV